MKFLATLAIISVASATTLQQLSAKNAEPEQPN